MSPALAQPPTEEQPALGGGLASPEANAPFVELAAAIRNHESAAGHAAVPKRPADHELYRTLTTLEQFDEHEPRSAVRGFVYEVESGRLREVD